MFKFLSHLFQVGNKKITLIMVQENRPAEPESFSFKPRNLFQVFAIGVLVSIALFFAFLALTPAGYLLFDREDTELRTMANNLNQRMVQISDSLKKRDKFIKSMQYVLMSQKDTTYAVNDYPSSSEFTDYESDSEITNEFIGTEFLERIKTIEPDKIIYSDRFATAPKFPAPTPLDGIITQRFDPQKKHFGIDIASSKGNVVRSIADGVVVSADWSINYGNTIQIQHGDGYISIIKHCSSLLKKEGDVVLKGDAIGVLGLSGVINSGPHTHIELWRNGIALDPEQYLLLD